ncbi:hypothetical protein SARC_09590 [Sphaeroforma arctica JP610]|uniref:MI domain-containing protein n=1 Tax=Sphaeroforma arctica JP610 TaxID=667725 RepID=A0A0L0FMH6_9EUKA|nr:hypothetical protein SARC_09590 [Sphaeroforma arctica JP610]KNC77960.1 hypothetical protein SARC_09590 [Sphaeroforma arctica JP610]|eukprot:XP_014151862.1 hypothetical protein SARC_09590 [Sphaeroforma arctica JP610]
MSNNHNSRGARNGASKGDRQTINQGSRGADNAQGTDKNMPRQGGPQGQQQQQAPPPFNPNQSGAPPPQQHQPRGPRPNMPKGTNGGNGMLPQQQGGGRGQFHHQMPYNIRPNFGFVPPPQFGAFQQYTQPYYAPSGTQYYSGIQGGGVPSGALGGAPTTQTQPPRVRKSCALQIIDPNSGKEVQVKKAEAKAAEEKAKSADAKAGKVSDDKAAEAEKKAQEEKERAAKAEEERIAKEKAEAERLAQEEKDKAEKEKKAEEARMAEEKRVEEERVKKEKEEAERKAKEEAERKAKEEAEKKAKEEAEKKAKEEAEKKAKEEAEKKAKEEAEKKAKEEAEKKVQEEKEKVEKEAAEKKAQEEKAKAEEAKKAEEKSLKEAAAKAGVPVDAEGKDGEEKKNMGAAMKALDGELTAIEKGEPTVVKPVYPEGTWSPSDKTGKKCYEMEFLKMFKSLIVKAPRDMIMHPEVAVDVVPQPLGGRAGGQRMNRMQSGGGDRNHQFSTPRNYTAGGGQGGQGQRQHSQGRRGGGGNRGYNQRNNQQNQPPPTTFINREGKVEALAPYVPLPKSSENAWKPKAAINTDAIEDEVKKEVMEIELMVRNGKALLNKLTVEKYDKIGKQLLSLPITSEARLKAVIDLLFDKALDEPGFSGLYARLCKDLSNQKYNFKGEGEAKTSNVNSFRRTLLNRCQTEFEREQVFASQEGVAAEEMDEKVVRAKLRQVGNIKFIGELFKLSILNEKVIHSCIYDLLKGKGKQKLPEEEDLVCLSNLMETVGKMLDVPNAAKMMDTYFDRIRELSEEKTLSSRVRCILMDIIDLRRMKWVPRKGDAGPKKIEDIHREAAKEAKKIEQRHAGGGRHDSHNRDNNSRGTRSNNQYGGRQQNNYGNNNSNNNNNQSNDGWNTVQARQPSTRADAGALRSLQSRAPSQGDRGAGVVLGPGGNSNAGRGFGHLDSGGVRLGPGGGSGSGAAGAGRRGNAFSMLNDHGSSEEKAPKLRGPLQLKPKQNNEAPAVPKPEEVKLSPEDFKKKFLAILNQAIVSGEVEDMLTTLKELGNAQHAPLMTDVVLNQAIEAKTAKRDKISKLYISISEAKLHTGSDIAKGLNELMPALDDITCDAPKAPEYIADVVGSALFSGLVKLEQLVKEVPALEEVRGELMSDAPAKTIAALVKYVQKTENEEKAKAVWTESGLKWSEILPEGDDEARFLKSQKLEFLN